MYKPRLIISSYDDLKNPYYAGGGAVAIHEVAKRLALEWEVRVITGKYRGSRNETIDGVKYSRVGISFLGPKLGQLVFQLCLPWLVTTKKFDIWIESFTPPFSTFFLPIFTKKPVVGLAHMLSAVDMQRKYKLPFPLVEKFGLKFYRRIITPSKVDAQKIRNINPKAEIISIPNGVESPICTSRRSGRRSFLSFIGRIEVNQKGLDLLLSAFKKISNEIPYKLQIAGDGEKSEVRKLINIIDKLELDSRVIYRRRVEGLERSDFFSQTLVMALPSRYETFSLVALETLAAGVSYVCFDIDGLRWLPDNCGIKVSSFDVGAFGMALLKLLKNPVLRRQYGHNAYLDSRYYSWDKSAKEYSDYLKQVLLYES